MTVAAAFVQVIPGARHRVLISAEYPRKLRRIPEPAGRRAQGFCGVGDQFCGVAGSSPDLGKHPFCGLCGYCGDLSAPDCLGCGKPLPIGSVGCTGCYAAGRIDGDGRATA